VRLHHFGSLDFTPLGITFGVGPGCFAVLPPLRTSLSVRLYGLWDMRAVWTSPAGGVGTPKYIATSASSLRLATCWEAIANPIGGQRPPVGYNVRVYDVRGNRTAYLEGEESATFHGGTGTRMAAFSPGGHMLAAIDAFRVRLFDVDRALEPGGSTTPLGFFLIKKYSDPRGIVWSPDGNWLVLRLSTEVGLWRLQGGGPSGPIKVEQVPFREGGAGTSASSSAGAVVFAPDSDLCAVATVFPNAIRLFNVSRQAVVAKTDKLPAEILHLAFSPDGRRLYSGDAKGTIAEWSVGDASSPGLAVTSAATLGKPILAMDVDPTESVLLVAAEARSGKGVDLFAATSSEAPDWPAGYLSRLSHERQRWAAASSAPSTGATAGGQGQPPVRATGIPPARPLRFNPAPGWPPASPGWAPPQGWQPDPSWPPPPPGWPFWIE